MSDIDVLMNQEREDFKKMSRYISNPNPQQILYNNTPLPDFLGLTPSEMESILYDPFAGDSDFFIRHIPNSELDKIPFFALTEHLILLIYRDKSIKLTKKGYLPCKYCEELLQQKFIEEKMYEWKIRKMSHEKYFSSITAARLVLLYSGVIKADKGRLRISDFGSYFLEEGRRFLLFREVFGAYCDDLLWARLDGNGSSTLIGQAGFVFSLAMLKHYGNVSRPLTFYLNKYKKAFPQVGKHVTNYSFMSSERQYIRCFSIRLFECFFRWFGLAKLDSEENIIEPEKMYYSKTNILDQYFATPLIEEYL
mgnify:CR=1 FL=1